MWCSASLTDAWFYVMYVCMCVCADASRGLREALGIVTPAQSTFFFFSFFLKSLELNK